MKWFVLLNVCHEITIKNPQLM